jgi:hypothetical protein
MGHNWFILGPIARVTTFQLLIVDRNYEAH